jgi:uncharacterized membrane protein YkvA (DUF1232 family)
MRRIFRLWRLAGSDIRLLWAALRHPNRPIWLLPATLALGFFALEPFNFAIPVLGVVDNLFLLPLLLHGLAKIAVTQLRYRQLRGRATIAWYRCNENFSVGRAVRAPALARHRRVRGVAVTLTRLPD